MANAESSTTYAASTHPSKNQFPAKSIQMSEYLMKKTDTTNMLSRRYHQLLRSEKYCDCLFHIGGVKVKCHQLILSAASPVFEAMFFGPCSAISTTQQDPKDIQEIDIPDISAEIFEILIKYIYSGIVDFESLTLEETVELYYCAEKYLLNDLIADCLLAITRKLRFSNILPALELCVCMDLSGLLEVCMSFFTRCCLSDSQYMSYHKTHYMHISKECIKAIIAVNKDEARKYLLWFVYEWCQHECQELGLQKSDCDLIIDDLELKSTDADNKATKDDVNDVVNMGRTLPRKLQQCNAIERNYYKACRPFVIDYDTHEWRLYVKCDRFISLRGIIMHSRLTPTLRAAAVALTPLAHLTHALAFANEYNENLRIEISMQQAALSSSDSDSEESDQEQGHQDHQCAAAAAEAEPLIWQHTVTKQATKYNCDFNINWPEGVILSPDIEYQIKVIWQEDAYGSEYPCSLQSNLVDGIHFRDFDTYSGSPIKGLQFLNLV